MVVSGERFGGAWRGAAIIGRVPEVQALLGELLAGPSLRVRPGLGWCMPALQRDVIGA